MYAVHVPSDDLDRNPKFAELHAQMDKKLTPHGISVKLQKCLEQAKQNISQARHTWFLNHILHNEVSELLADLELKNQEGNIPLGEKQLKDVLSITLAHSELEHYLQYQPDPNSRSTLFNLSSRDIAQHNPVAKHIAAVQQTALPLVEDRLRQKCENIYNFYQNEKDDCTEQLMITKSLSLPAVIEQRVRKLEQNKKTLELNNLKRIKQFWFYYQKLLEGISLMKQMLKTYKMKNKSEADHLNISWLKAKCDAFCCKLQLTQLQTLCKTYDSESVKALAKIGSYLDTALQQTQKELSSTQHTLNGYHAIGGEFESLVAEFTQLQTEVENQQWGLSQLGRWGNRAENTANAMAKMSENDTIPENMASV